LQHNYGSYKLIKSLFDAEIFDFKVIHKSLSIPINFIVDLKKTLSAENDKKTKVMLSFYQLKNQNINKKQLGNLNFQVPSYYNVF
jgi:hypothetical protein